MMDGGGRAAELGAGTCSGSRLSERGRYSRWMETDGAGLSRLWNATVDRDRGL